jgi:H+/Cl- antiporter ClcA
MPDRTRAANGARWPTLVVVTVLVGIAAGLGGMSLVVILRLTQHIAYGYSLGAVISKESFLEGVSHSSPMRRVLVLTICGLLAGTGRWALYRLSRPLVGVRRALEPDGPRMPGVATTVHAIVQIVTVGLGSPLGREAAPREISAAFAGWLSARARLSGEDSRTLIACGAGAGLAAVYNVPLGGALFALEVLLGTFRMSAVVPAIATSVIASLVAWIALGDEWQFAVPQFPISASLVAWSIVVGPLLGFAAYWYAHLMTASHRLAPRDWRLLIACPATFIVIGLLAIPFPQLLGNGKGPTLLGFESQLGISVAAALLLLKVLATAGSLRAGAEGGVLTPSLTIGAMLGTIGGSVWNLVGPGVPLGAFAIVGAAAFLAASMKMPVTAIVLAVEFTRVDHDFLIPILFAVAGSIAAFELNARRDAVAHHIQD